MAIVTQLTISAEIVSIGGEVGYSTRSHGRFHDSILIFNLCEHGWWYLIKPSMIRGTFRLKLGLQDGCNIVSLRIHRLQRRSGLASGVRRC
jgi:hypothetical protein